ncbi:MAG: hypothetical protein WBB29_15885 [Geitlerinemataceae cyanobacterium]
MINLSSRPSRTELLRSKMPVEPRSAISSSLAQDSLQEIARSVEWSQGEFSLILAHCNSCRLREQALQQLHHICSVPFREISLDRSVDFLYATIQEKLGRESPQALTIWGFESVEELDRLLVVTNFIFGEFQKNFHFPLIWWVDDATVRKLIRLAPDLYSRTTIVELTRSREAAIAAA